MTKALQSVIAAVRALSPHDQWELFEVLVEDLSNQPASGALGDDFWTSQPLDELLQSQPAGVVADVRNLAVDFWPEDESADAFNEFVSAQRQADLSIEHR